MHLKINPSQSYPIWEILIRLKIWLILVSAIKISFKHRLSQKKIELLTKKTKGRTDILLVLITKIDKTSPDSEFKVNSFNKPYRVDRNKKGDGIMLSF